MRFAVDAHAIGRRQTGNEVYIRNLLHHFPRLDRENTFSAFYSQTDAANDIPRGHRESQVSANPYIRLGIDLPRWTQREKPAVLHVQYTGPLFKRSAVSLPAFTTSVSSNAPISLRGIAPRNCVLTVQRTIESAAQGHHGERVFAAGHSAALSSLAEQSHHHSQWRRGLLSAHGSRIGQTHTGRSQRVSASRLC